MFSLGVVSENEVLKWTLEECKWLFFSCRLELWPGFVTSILQYERNVMLNLDVSHKILRTDTVYDYMNATYISGRPNFHDTVTKELVGEIVLTRYIYILKMLVM